MVAGLKFLSKKGFNPQNMTNQKRVWEARQTQKQEEQKLRERNDQLKRERDDEELAKARGDHLRLTFMYQPPPGMETAEGGAAAAIAAVETQQQNNDEDGDCKPSAVTSQPKSQEPDITQVQEGDDPAAAEFRRMLAAATAGEVVDDDEEESKYHQQSQIISHGTAFQGTSVEKDNSKGKEGLSALEKSVGRRDGNQSLSLDEQVARFPQLKNAPMAKGMNGTDVGVAFKPLGAQLRNVRCLACGIWGHSRGERECEKSGWNPFAAKGPLTSVRSAKLVARDDGNKSSSGKDGDDNQSIRSHSSSEDSHHRRRKRRKKESKRRRRKEESKKSKRRPRSRSESSEEDRKHRKRRSRSDSSHEDRKHRKKSSKKSSSRRTEPSSP